MRRFAMGLAGLAALLLGPAASAAAGDYAFAGVASRNIFYVDMKSLKIDPETRQVFGLVMDVPPRAMQIDEGVQSSPMDFNQHGRFDYRIIRETVDCRANQIKIGAFVRYRFDIRPAVEILEAPEKEDFERIPARTMGMYVADVMCGRRPARQMREFIGDANEIAKAAWDSISTLPGPPTRRGVGR